MSDRFAKFWSQFEAVKEAMPDRAPLVYPPTAQPGNDISPEFVYEDGHGLFGPTVTDSAQTCRDLRIGTPDTDQSDKPAQRRPVQGDMLEFLDKVALRGNDATAHHLISICPVNLCPADEPATANQPYWPPYNPNGGGDGVTIRVLDTGLFEGYKNLTVVEDASGQRRNTFETVPASPPIPTLPIPLFGPPVQGIDAGTVSGGTEKLIRLYAGHGTFIAGLVGCIAPGAEVFVERSFELAGTAWEYELGPALMRALLTKPDIISLSAGGTSHRRKPYLGLQEFLDALANDDHTLLVAAAGNEGVSQLLTPAADAAGQPSNPPAIVAVGALCEDQMGVACFSNYGAGVTVYAPGERMVGVFPKGKYQYVEPHFQACQYHVPAPYKDCTCLTKPEPGKRADFANVARWSGTSFATPIVAAMTAAHYAANRTTFPSPRHAFAHLLETEGKPFRLNLPETGTDEGVQLVPASMKHSDEIPFDLRIRLT